MSSPKNYLLRAVLIALLSNSVLHANDLVPLTAAETQEVVAAVTAQQAQFEQAAGRWRLTVKGLPTFSDDKRLDDMVVDGEIQWARLGSSERLSLRYDLPEEKRIQNYHECDFHIEGDLHTTRFLPSNQVLIVRQKSLSHWLTPVDLILVYRNTIDAWISKGAQVDGARDGESYLLTLTLPQSHGGRRVEVSVDPVRGYLVTGWREPQINREVRIDWTSGDSGAFVPARVILSASGFNPPRRWTLETQSFTFGPVDPKLVEFEFVPGMLVGDYSHVPLGETPTNPKVYKIDENGRRAAVTLVEQPNPVSGAQRSIIGVSSFLLAGAVLAFRLAFMRQQ